MPVDILFGTEISACCHIFTALPLLYGELLSAGDANGSAAVTLAVAVVCLWSFMSKVCNV